MDLEKIANSKITGGSFRVAQKIKHTYEFQHATSGKQTFEDRRKNSSTLVIIIAGYKKFLYDDVFTRAEQFIPRDYDVCIVSSGIFDLQLSAIAAKYNWSYLSTKRNCVTLVQNKVIALYPSAEYIFKMDEDIFLTEHCFETMLDTYRRVEEEGLYDVGFVAPLLNVNGYCHVRLLDRYGRRTVFEQKFEKVKYASYDSRQIENNPETAAFMWGRDGNLPTVDQMNADGQKQDFSYSVCPVRFSIGFILFRRDLWKSMRMWKVSRGANMGHDETQICQYCISQSKGIIIAENTVCGHFSFGPQTGAMKKVFESHPELFHLEQKQNG